MELKTERVPVMLEPSILRKIDDLRFANRIGSRSEAMRQLIHKGLNASNVETKKADAA